MKMESNIYSISAKPVKVFYCTFCDTKIRSPNEVWSCPNCKGNVIELKKD